MKLDLDHSLDAVELGRIWNPKPIFKNNIGHCPVKKMK